MPCLHVVVPVYNERDTLEPCLRRVAATDLPPGWSLALQLVDDHSDAAAHEVTEACARQLRTEGHPVSLLRHERNRGKGAAVQSGFDAILSGGADDRDVVVIQDADLEYDPADFPALLEPIVAGRSGAVVGNRWAVEDRTARGLKRALHEAGNRMLTRCSNLMTGYRLHDMECCYKLLRLDVLRRVRPLLAESRFGIEPQLVAGLAHLGETLVEIPVRYEPRGLQAGKKIRWIDGVRAIYVIIREGLARPPRRPAMSAPAAPRQTERTP